jgi:hypothetical protein
MVRREVQDNDVGHIAIGWHMREKFLQSLDAARRSAYPDDEKVFARLPTRVFRAVRIIVCKRAAHIKISAARILK